LFESSLGGDTIYIKEGHEQTKIKLHDILYLEALKDYTYWLLKKKALCGPILAHCSNMSISNHLLEFIGVLLSKNLLAKFS
jgi:hypothetical protein